MLYSSNFRRFLTKEYTLSCKLDINHSVSGTMCTVAHTYTTTHRNKTVDRIKHILHWYFQQKQSLSIKTCLTQHT